ncbi:MAG: 3-deoxy-8-phosphooctulonate synthase [Bacteroidales bacterium]|jgi:2-dehydro-3-deoxyphosphooctonate aldolase (KDO 8-P synthase)|nr:3-deoxy-8-phosphooctulonate synthase [Bacteroidales bacterium]
MDYDQIKNNTNSFFLIAGPCVIEDEQMPYDIASKLVGITARLGIDFIFKASYRKANRSRLDSFTGIGDDEKGLAILKDIGKMFNVPVLTDIHSDVEAQKAAQYVDVLQIPAFLCRQTDLLVAAAKTGKIINIKKGQFLSASSMRYAVEKVRQSGNDKIMLTDRGTMFGYQDLIVDFRSIPVMQNNGVPVIMDITHSLQQPNQQEGVTGGQPKMIETIAKAAIAVGADGIFMETHPNPSQAKSDGANMLPLDDVEALLTKLLKIKSAI